MLQKFSTIIFETKLWTNGTKSQPGLTQQMPVTAKRNLRHFADQCDGL